MLKLNNTTSTSLTAVQTIPLNKVLSTNSNVTFASNTITFKKAGYYDINAMFTLTGATVGDYTIQAYAGTTAIPDAVVTGTIATANDYITLTFVDIERVISQTDLTNATLSFVLTDGAGAVTMTNANVSVVEIR